MNFLRMTKIKVDDRVEMHKGDYKGKKGIVTAILPASFAVKITVDGKSKIIRPRKTSVRRIANLKNLNSKFGRLLQEDEELHEAFKGFTEQLKALGIFDLEEDGVNEGIQIAVLL
jgi:ribosomal protein L24